MPPYASPWVQVYLLDDHDLVRRGVRDLLEAAKDIHVVGESSSAQGAAEAIVRIEATVMLLDVQLQDGTGIEVCRRVHAVAPEVRGLLLTSLWYIREVDPQTLLLTGLTRDGVYLVEDGEITAGVNNYRFNESPIDLLDRFSEASRTVPSFSRTATR